MSNNPRAMKAAANNAPARDRRDRNVKEREVDVIRPADSTPRAVADAFVFGVRMKDRERRLKAAKELHKFVSCDLRDEPAEYVAEFMNCMDSRTEPCHIVECMQSTDMDHRKAGILLVACLAEVSFGPVADANRVVRYANYILRIIDSLDDAGLQIASKTLAYLIQTSKSYAAELVEKCLDQSLEWLQEMMPEKLGQRRLAATTLVRDLAIYTPTSFFLRANVFFKNIFNVMRDNNAGVRIAAAQALNAALVITSQREAKQKTEWYNKCYTEAERCLDPSKDGEKALSMAPLDRYHAALLIINELVRIADANYEKIRLAAFGEKTSNDQLITVVGSDPIDFVNSKRQPNTVESTTAKALVRQNFSKICEITAQALANRGKDPAAPIFGLVLELIPRLTAFKECSEKYHKTFFDTMKTMNVGSKNSSAFVALGLMMVQNPDRHRSSGQQLISLVDINFLAQPKPPASKTEILTNMMMKKASSKNQPDRSIFIFLTLYIRAYKEAAAPEIKPLLPSLFRFGLSEGLTDVLHEVMRSIRSLKMEVQDGLMQELHLLLIGSPLPSKIDPPQQPLVPTTPISISSEKERLIILGLETLGGFEFQRQSLRMFMQYIAEGYLVCDSLNIRLAAVSCCASMLKPFIRDYDDNYKQLRHWTSALISGVLRSISMAAVVDPQVEVRLCVLQCFCEADRAFLSHLSQPEMLELQFMPLHDEKLEMQEAAVCLLGRLAELNPALVLPRMRRVLLETLSQLVHSGQSRLEQHSARLLTQLARQSPKFMRPYMAPLLQALLPKLRPELKHVDVTVNVLHGISELAVVGGSEMVKCIDPLFSKLTQFITDSSSLQRREASLRAIGNVCRSTAYVVDPYKDYPTLLDDLLRLLKTEMSSSMRRQAIKVLGVLGALDPYTHKVFTGAVQSATSISTALSLPISRDAADPRQDIIQWFNYEKCTLEEFYPAITIANLMVMVHDDAFAQYYKDITQALLTIFRSLSPETYPQYVQQVVPRFIEVARASRASRDFFLRQLASLVAIIKQHAKPYMKQIFALIAEAWSEEDPVRRTVVSVLEQIGTALEQDFSPHVAELIPYLLRVVQTDKALDRRLTQQVLSCVRSLSGCLTPHLHLVLPPILAIIDDRNIIKECRIQALETILHLARTDDVSDYAPRLMQTWQKNIMLLEVQPMLLELLLEIVKQMWKQFGVFRASVDALLVKCELMKHPLVAQYTQLASEAVNSKEARMKKEKPVMDLKSTSSTTQMYTRNTPSAAKSMAQILTFQVNKQKVNTETVARAWSTEGLVSKEEWTQWLIRLRVAFIKSGSSAAIRAAASLSDQHQHLAKDLFNAAFMSVWTELKESAQDELSKSLLTALDESNHSDVVQTILNLAEFMDHSEKGPLPIPYERLGRSAEDTRAYAKALRYKELEIHKRFNADRNARLTPEDCQALITYANKLNVQELAAGVVRYAELNDMVDAVSPMQGRWYEKLNEWDKALKSYENDRSRQSSYGTDDVSVRELRCLEALGQWGELNKRARLIDKKDQKAAVMAARGAWAVGDWLTMNEYVGRVNENSQDGSLLRAVLAVHKGNYDNAIQYIDKVRDMYDSELTAMASESYERAYGAMVLVQQLAELEEAIEYKLRADRRPRIALLWSRRLQGCRQNIEQWQRLLMLRSLVLSPQEMHPLRVKFSSLCRKQGKVSMCENVLRDLLNLPQDAPLHMASAPNDKPQLVLALCKQLWKDELKNAAVNTLDALVRQLDKLPPTTHSPEAARLGAKAYLKLGEWTDTMAKTEMAKKPTAVIFTPMSNQEAKATKEMIRCFTRSTEYDQNWHKAWHKLASAFFYAMAREKELATQNANRRAMTAPMGMAPMIAMPPHPLPLQPLPSPGVPAHIIAPMGNLSLTMPNPQQPQICSMGFVPPQLSPLAMPMPSPQPIQLNLAYAVMAVKCFAKALHLAPGSRLEDTLRLLQLWFDYGENEEVYSQLRDNIKGLPIETWLEVVPQLMARLDSKDRQASLIKQVIHDISKDKPQALVYQLTVAAKSSNEDRRQNARELLTLMGEMHPRLVEEARMVSEELVRCAILWHEQWHDALDEASRLYFQEKKIQAMLEVLHPMHRMIEAGPKTLKEQSFHQTYYSDLMDAFKFCQAFERSKNPKELTQAWEIYCQTFKRITAQLRQLNTLDLNYISPMLMRAKDLELAVPGTYDPSSDVVHIASFVPYMQVISSKQRPRKMTIRGSNGLEYVFLLKGHEDPRQDERVMQLFGLVNTLLVNNAETCRRNLTIQRYSIIALSQNSGLIGWVPDCDTLHGLVRDYREKKKYSLSVEHKKMQLLAPDTEQLTLYQKIQLFERALSSTSGDDLQHILWLKSPSSEVWFDRRTNYTRSMACMSMVGYILGLGDRHPSNLMLDRLTGKIVHIDFGDCFDVAMSREKFPEKIPFRLTRMLIKAMEVTGIEGNYRFTCERVLHLLRTNRESLLAVLEAFVYDPVINWRLLDANKRVHPGEKIDFSKKIIEQEAPRQVSQEVIDRIKNKLTGREFEPNTEVGESEQIERLVEQATMPENLCQCYIGWCPFW